MAVELGIIHGYFLVDICLRDGDEMPMLGRKEPYLAQAPNDTLTLDQKTFWEKLVQYRVRWCEGRRAERENNTAFPHAMHVK